MKQILLVLLVTMTMQLHGQIFSADFNDKTLNGMKAVDLDGKSPHADVAAFKDAWNVMDLFQNGNFAAYSTSYFTPVGQANDWLISPKISIPADKTYSLLFRAIAPDKDFRDGFEVRVSTTTDTTTSFTDLLLKVEAEEAAWTNRSVDLSNYAGKDIYFAIVNNSDDKYILGIDDIQIVELASNEIAVSSYDTTAFGLLNSTFAPVVTVENKGSNELKSVDFTYTLNGTEVTETVTGLSIKTFDKAQVSFPTPIKIEESKHFDFTIKLSKPNGEVDDESDNNAKYALTGVSKKVNRVAIVEKGTGTWCGWCPSGIVAFDQMDEKYDDNYIGISVHKGDPMEFEGYVDDLGFEGYPSAHLNRQFRGLNPLAFVDVIPQFNQLLTPVDVEAEVKFDAATRKTTINTSVNAYTNMNDANMKVAVIMTQNNVTGTESGYAQANYFAGGGSGNMGGFENKPNPVPAKDMVYNHVARAALAGASGTADAIDKDIKDGSTYTYSFEYTVPEEFDATKMYAVVMVLDKNGIIVTGTEERVEMGVSVGETPTLMEANIYPNPTKDFALLSMDFEKASDAKVSIMDLTGKVVSTTAYTNMQGAVNFELNVSNLNAGVYVVQVDSKNGLATKRLVVSK